MRNQETNPKKRLPTWVRFLLPSLLLSPIFYIGITYYANQTVDVGSIEIKKEILPVVGAVTVTLFSETGAASQYEIDCNTEPSFCSEFVRSGLTKAPVETEMCTLQYGGRAEATVVGTLTPKGSGEKVVSLKFTQRNGCEIGRYQALQRAIELVTATQPTPSTPEPIEGPRTPIP